MIHARSSHERGRMAQPLLVGEYPWLTLLVSIRSCAPIPAWQLPFQFPPEADFTADGKRRRLDYKLRL
jgi:hypothetical protein